MIAAAASCATVFSMAVLWTPRRRPFPLWHMCCFALHGCQRSIIIRETSFQLSMDKVVPWADWQRRYVEVDVQCCVSCMGFCHIANKVLCTSCSSRGTFTVSSSRALGRVTAQRCLLLAVFSSLRYLRY